MNSEELKLCPFCGNKPRLSHTIMDQKTVVCDADPECAIHGHIQLLIRWNTRSTQELQRLDFTKLLGILELSAGDSCYRIAENIYEKFGNSPRREPVWPEKKIEEEMKEQSVTVENLDGKVSKGKAKRKVFYPNNIEFNKAIDACKKAWEES